MHKWDTTILSILAADNFMTTGPGYGEIPPFLKANKNHKANKDKKKKRKSKMKSKRKNR